MNMSQWEETVQAIVNDSNLQPKEAGKHRVLTEWRTKLEREPTLLSPHKIDEIVREVRRRLETSGNKR